MWRGTILQNRGMILWGVARFWAQKIFPIEVKVNARNKGYDLESQKCDFET